MRSEKKRPAGRAARNTRTAAPAKTPGGRAAENSGAGFFAAEDHTAGRFTAHHSHGESPAVNRIIVIGGGASGLAAALAAADVVGGAHVLILERLERVGKKLLATGNGRCNLTNRTASPAAYHTAHPERLAAMLNQTPPDAVLRFFAELGLLCDTQPDGRVYPYCYQASMVLDVLRAALARAGVAVACGQTAARLCRDEEGFVVETQEGGRYPAACVVLAAGGSAAPQFGTDGAGYALARAAGHSVLPPYPCLVPLRCARFPAGLKGTRANGVLTLWDGAHALCAARGEIQFAEYGLSGIPAMQLSCLLPRAKRPEAAVDLFPDISANDLRALLAQRCTGGAFSTLETLLLGLVGKKLGYAALKASGQASLSRASAQLSPAALDALTQALKDWRFAVEGTLPWTQAQATGGGVPLDEVEETCASRKCPGLYLTGELLDAVGDCGGFNLQWAWATGLAAGQDAGRRALRRR